MADASSSFHRCASGVATRVCCCLYPSRRGDATKPPKGEMEHLLGGGGGTAAARPSRADADKAQRLWSKAVEAHARGDVEKVRSHSRAPGLSSSEEEDTRCATSGGDAVHRGRAARRLALRRAVAPGHGAARRRRPRQRRRVLPPRARPRRVEPLGAVQPGLRLRRAAPLRRGDRVLRGRAARRAQGHRRGDQHRQLPHAEGRHGQGDRDVSPRRPRRRRVRHRTLQPRVGAARAARPPRRRGALLAHDCARVLELGVRSGLLCLSRRAAYLSHRESCRRRA